MTWYLYDADVATENLQRATSLFGSLRGVLLTERKTLSPNMTSAERRLNFPKWDVPSAPGYYKVTFGLLMG
jgi:hypothetical protein